MGGKKIGKCLNNMIKNVASGLNIRLHLDSCQWVQKFCFVLLYSLLPYSLHPVVAKSCIAHKKNLLTTSYVLPAIEELHQR